MHDGREQTVESAQETSPRRKLFFIIIFPANTHTHVITPNQTRPSLGIGSMHLIEVNAMWHYDAEDLIAMAMFSLKTTESS